MRGMALVNAATLVAELGDLARFANPRQLMAYLGLVPSEHSSGASVKRGGLTRAGNSAARRLLIEAAWTYRFPARVSRALRLRQEAQPRAIREIAWKAGGVGGIDHFLDQFAAPMADWWETLGKPTLTSELQERLAADIAAETAGRSIAELAAWRDLFLVDLLALKAGRK